jgi:hypothetical protein|tara:strand:- start:288 stop:1229 length:942 start_codon:yes stop_codon:yes gene_type:complete
MATDTTIQQVEYPQVIKEAQEKLLNSVYGTSATPGLIDQATTVPQQQVQGFTQPQTDAFALAQQGIGGFQPYLQSGLGQQFGAAGTAGQGVQSLQGMNFDPSNVSQFMDPYQQNVTQEALKEIDRQSAMAGNQLAGKAVGAGAFGGSRFGLQQSELARNTQDLKSRRIFEDLSRNFQQAQAANNSANQQRMQQGQIFGQLANQQSSIGGQIAGLGGAQQSLAANDVNTLSGIGGLQQQLGQNILNTNTANQAAAQQLPFNTASFASNILAQQAPFGGSQTQTISPFAQTNPYAQAFGAVGSLSGQGGLASLLK